LEEAAKANLIAEISSKKERAIDLPIAIPSIIAERQKGQTYPTPLKAVIQAYIKPSGELLLAPKVVQRSGFEALDEVAVKTITERYLADYLKANPPTGMTVINFNITFNVPKEA
jgi:hypothetical protein